MRTDPDCIFCKIVAGQIPSTKSYESETVLAIADIDPKAPTHVLVIPKAHYATVAELAAADADVLAELVTVTQHVADQARDEHSQGSGSQAEAGHAAYRLVFNSGAAAGQSVDHVHGHVLAGRPLQWPPG